MKKKMTFGLRLCALPMLLLLEILVTTVASADPLVITVSGTASGKLGANSFSSSMFTFTLTTDTKLLKTNKDIGITDTPIGTPTTFTIVGVGSGMFTDDQQVFVDPMQRSFGGAIGFAHFETILLVVLESQQLVGYDFS